MTHQASHLVNQLKANLTRPNGGQVRGQVTEGTEVTQQEPGYIARPLQWLYLLRDLGFVLYGDFKAILGTYLRIGVEITCLVILNNWQGRPLQRAVLALCAVLCLFQFELERTFSNFYTFLTIFYVFETIC